MYGPEWNRIEQVISCLTNIYYDEVKCILEMDEDDIGLVVDSCNNTFDDLDMGFKVVYRNGYFERIEK